MQHSVSYMSYVFIRGPDHDNVREMLRWIHEHQKSKNFLIYSHLTGSTNRRTCQDMFVGYL